MAWVCWKNQGQIYIKHRLWLRESMAIPMAWQLPSLLLGFAQCLGSTQSRRHFNDWMPHLNTRPLPKTATSQALRKSQSTRMQLVSLAATQQNLVPRRQNRYDSSSVIFQKTQRGHPKGTILLSRSWVKFGYKVMVSAHLKNGKINNNHPRQEGTSKLQKLPNWSGLK